MLQKFLCLAVLCLFAFGFLTGVVSADDSKQNNPPAPASCISIPSGSHLRNPGPFVPPVNLSKDYKKEPAPMGIGDYGVVPNSTQWYNYTTPEFLGDCNMIGLSSYNSSLGSSAYQISIQLNVVLGFKVGTVLYYYWIQDVGFYDSSSKKMGYENNIWNMSSNKTNKLTNTLKGNGTVQTYNTTFDYYYCDAGTRAGNNVVLTLPHDTQYLVVASFVSNHPHVAFEYDDGYNWQTYDNVTFSFAAGATNVSFIVSGHNYNPHGTFIDAELILGGPGGGAYTAIQNGTNTQFTIEFWNGHNFQEIINAYNFGSDTAESVSGALENGFGYDGNGTVYTVATHGTSPLAGAYGRDQIALLNVSSPALSRGVLFVNGLSHSYVGNDVNLTLAPGFYQLLLYNGASLYWYYNVTLTAGEYCFLVAGGSVPEISFSPAIIMSVLLITAIAVKCRRLN